MERNPALFLNRRSAGLLREARESWAASLGARAEDLIFVSNATSGVNLVARSLVLAPGDEVLTTDLEYGACTPPGAEHAGRPEQACVSFVCLCR